MTTRRETEMRALRAAHDAQHGATGLQGAELEEMNRGMGLAGEGPRAPYVDGSGQFTLHTVKPGDMPRLAHRLAHRTTRAHGLHGAELDFVNRGMGLGADASPVQGRQANGTFELHVQRPSEASAIRFGTPQRMDGGSR